MNDKQFEISMIVITVIVLLWMILGSIFLHSIALPVITGIIIWLIVGVVLLYIWGKSYMNKM